MKKLGLFLFAFVISNVGIAQETLLKFEADVTNRNGDILFIKNNRIIVKEIKVQGDGHFSASFDIKEGMYQLYDGAEYSELFLKNGYDLKMKLDAKNFDNSITYSGIGAKENNYLAQKIRTQSSSDVESFFELPTMEEFAAKMTEKQNADIAKLDAEKLDAGFVALQKKAMQAEMLEMKMYFAEKLKQKKLNNTQAPSFDYENHAGGKTKLEDLRGKYVYIDVWATWCGPCRAEIPSLQKIEAKYHDKKIAFVSISVDEQKDYEKWKKFVVEKQLGGIQLYADKNWMSDFIKAFGINSIPRFILIDPTGKVVNADADRPSNPKLQEQLDALLK
ncbi:TlpA disulfide reductase family protein [Flavobacterium sp.]|uniref:TlpA family protein disulfide reductase n=1 Tax=Flavobacterium sp. TaxID=239 RepID=UPI002606A599|nr:TlpA disulfide reductase family protein [Flavobacterium sp.]